jgi:Protein of unknown function (DUF3891)
MIVRPAAPSQLLITQPDHAALAVRIMREWRVGGLQDSPRRAWILLAIEEHDNGWLEVDTAPIVDEKTGHILDFVTAPDEIRQSIWPRGVKRLAGTPYAAALVAQHALHVYRRHRGDAGWAPFFSELEATRNQHLRAVKSVSLDDLLCDYVFVRIGDLVSLTFCNGWNEVQTDDGGYAIRLDGERLRVTPDPFEGRQIAIDVRAREIPNGPFQSAPDAKRAFDAARQIALTGICSS